ncbi:hypothetical protein RUND412_002423 [Rhizina undulata]
MAVRSLLNVNPTEDITDHSLPRYTPHPEDRAEVASLAPSYHTLDRHDHETNAQEDRDGGTSSSAPQHQQRYTSLIPSSGISAPYHTPSLDVCVYSSIAGTPYQSRAYRNVAARRAARDASRQSDNPENVRRHRSTARMRVEGQHPELGEEGEGSGPAGRGKNPLEKENEAWDFMLSQMKEWEEKERSWVFFRKRYNESQRRGFGTFGPWSGRF